MINQQKFKNAWPALIEGCQDRRSIFGRYIEQFKNMYELFFRFTEYHEPKTYEPVKLEWVMSRDELFEACIVFPNFTSRPPWFIRNDMFGTGSLVVREIFIDAGLNI
jgi:hypothetical protein